MTSEDPHLDQPVPADKPKRGRKPKAATQQAASESPSTTLDSASVLPVDNAVIGTDAAPHELDRPEDFAAALGQETAPTATAQATAVQPLSACGGVLKAAREAMGLSIHEVSGQLRLGVKQIQAIEQDDFAQLPQASIVRGFIRNYARLLNIDPQPVLLAYQQLVPQPVPTSLSVRSNARHSVIEGHTQRVKPQGLLTLLLLLGALAIAAYFYLSHVKPQALNEATLSPEMTVEAPSAPTTSSVVTAPGNDTTEVLLPEQPSTTQALDPNAPEAAGAITQPLTLPAAPSTPVSDSTVAISATPANIAPLSPPIDTATNAAAPLTDTANSGVISASADGSTLKAGDPQVSRLEITVIEESWVRIEDPQGKKLFSALIPAGTQRQVLVKKPVNLTIGHAAGTQLRVDNQPYDLMQATRGRVARLQLN